MNRDEIEKLLDGTTPGPWRAEGEPWNRIVWSSADNRVCFMAHSNGLDDARDVATSNLAAAAPDLARTALNALARLEDAEAAQAQALVLERAVAIGADIAERTRPDGFPEEASNAYHSGAMDVVDAIRALADPSGVAALAALRAERDELAERLQSAMMDGHDLAKNEYRAAIQSAEAERDDALARLAAAEGRVGVLRAERRMIVSHATMGGTDGEGLSVNEISVRITALRNSLYQEARAALATVTPLVDTGEGA